MQVSTLNLADFAQQLRQERKRQGLTRSQAAGRRSTTRNCAARSRWKPSVPASAYFGAGVPIVQR